jgi:predicted peptidase
MRSAPEPLSIVLVLSAFVLSAAVARAADPTDLRSQLEKRVYKNAKGETLPYRLFVPKDYDSSRKYPIILFMHGAGERGTDNQAQLVHSQVLGLVSGEVAKKHPCFLVAPQCPDKMKWVEVPWEFRTPHQTPPEPSVPMRLMMELLDALEKEFSIDPARRYVTGLSMGGFGTFDLCARRPKDIAAAIPVCGGADDSKAPEMAGVAFWVFHGGNDGVVPVVRSRSAVEALKKAGAKVKFTEYAGMGHDSWTKAYYEPGLAEWLFSQHR